ncbi:MAG: FHA domain-containing protein, partial [Gammaproteobacteria bacterium]|nr:FHA domain-containing protein [Gammaproteobacteria bacterium]
QSSSRETLLAERDTQLAESRQARQDLEADLARVQAELAAANERLRALEGSAEQERQGSSQLHAELERLRGERAELDIALAAARTAAADAAAEVSAREKALSAEHARVAELETTLTEERQRAAGLDDELSTTRDEMAEWSGVLKTLQQQRNEQLAGSSVSEARVRELERELAGQRATAAALKAEGEGRAIRVRELEADLRAAEDTVHRLESELRNRSAHAAELTRSPPAGQRREEARASAADATLVDARSPGARQVTEPVADGTARLLIRDDGGRELVHVLGRKTSIGRTADNDLQIDAKFISRHHAVILAGPAQTIIEDLNSTNGVLVNGRRITRQILNDGDQVTIGRALYRFAVRRSGEKR